MPVLSVSRRSRFVALVGAWITLFVVAFAMSSISGCTQRPPDLAGSWKDVSVDGAGALSAVDRERMRYHLELKSDGTGTFTTGGTPRNAPTQAEPAPHDIQWSLTGTKLVVYDKENHRAVFTVSDDHKAISGDGNQSTFSKDIVSFVKQGE